VTQAPPLIRLPVDIAQGIDRLERNRFARYVLDIVMQVDAECGAVVGLDGAWGSGKTWVLKQLDAVAQDAPETTRPLFLRFNPWMVSGSNDLVVALLGQLSTQLAEAGRKAGLARATLTKTVKSIDKYANALVAIKHISPALDGLLPGAGIVVGGVAAASEAVGKAAQKIVPALPIAAARKSLPALRQDIETSLRAYDRKLVVVIDDLDRIATADVASMVQAVKAVADFPNVVYLLAYDADTLAASLQQSLGVADGRAYLEKIVQLPVPMPELPASRFQRFAESRLSDAVSGLEISDDERADLGEASSLAAALLKTPRDVARIRTRLGVVLPALAGHVNLADIVLAEIVQLKVPAFLPWMRANSSAVLALGIEQHDAVLVSRGLVGESRENWVDSNEQREAKAQARQEELRELTGQDSTLRRSFQSAIEFLFESLQSFHSNTSRRSKYRRLQRFRHWYQWQCVCDHHEPLTAPEVQSLASTPAQVHSNGWLLDQERFTVLCKHVCDLGLDDLEGANSAGWLEVFAEAERLFGAICVVDYGMGLGPAAAFTTILRLDPSGREQTICQAIAKGPVSLAGSLLVDIKRQTDQTRGRASLIEATSQAELAKQWFIRADAAIRGADWNAPESDFAPYTLAHWMRLLGRDASEISALVTDVLRANAERLRHFFGSLIDKPVYEHFPLHVEWDILPQASVLLSWVERASGFRQSHSVFCRHLDQRTQDAVGATPLAATSANAASAAP
jgi:hypothetical protein